MITGLKPNPNIKVKKPEDIIKEQCRNRKRVSRHMTKHTTSECPAVKQNVESFQHYVSTRTTKRNTVTNAIVQLGG